MEFINPKQRRENANKNQKQIEELLSILAQKGVITEADANKVKDKK